MSFNLMGSDLPLVHAGLVKFTKMVADSMLRVTLDPTAYAEELKKIEGVMPHVYDMTDRIKHRYDSTIRLAQLDYRRHVALARKIEPDDRDQRAMLIDVHTAQYKLTCHYATVGYKNSMRLVYRTIAAVADFKLTHCESTSA